MKKKGRTKQQKNKTKPLGVTACSTKIDFFQNIQRWEKKKSFKKKVRIHALDQEKNKTRKNVRNHANDHAIDEEKSFKIYFAFLIKIPTCAFPILAL